MLVVVDVVAEGMAWGGGIRFEALRTGGRVVVVPSHPAVGIWGGFGS
jgi:adenine-specific DNA methylase